MFDKQEIPRSSIASVIHRADHLRTEETLENIIFSIQTCTAEALRHPSPALRKAIDRPHPKIPQQTVRALATGAATDLQAIDTQGHLFFVLTEDTDGPMFRVIRKSCTDCPGSTSIYIALSVNVAHPFISFWLHKSPPEDVLKLAVQAFADAAVTLATELRNHPGTVLYRNELPVRPN